MKFRAPRTSFAQAARAVARALPTLAPVPAYNGMVLDGEGETVTLAGFDGSVTARHTAPAEVIEAGRVLLPGRLLADIAANARGDDLDVSADEGAVTVVCSTSRYTVPRLSLDDYPELPAHPDPTGTTPVDRLLAAVRHAATIAATASTGRVAIDANIHLRAENETLTVEATDGYRSAAHTLPWEGQPGEAIVPAKPLTVAVAALADQEAVLALGERRALVGVGDGRHRCALRPIDAPWPDLSRSYADDGGPSIELDATELLAAIKQVDLLGHDQVRLLRLEFAADGLTMHTEDGTSTAFAHVDAALCGLEHLRVVYQPQFLRTGLEPLAGTVRITPTRKRSHLLSAPGDDAYRYLFMPVKDPWSSEDGS